MNRSPLVATCVIVLAALVGSCCAPPPPSPSVVASPTDDPAIHVGTYPLATERPPVVDGDTIRVDGLRQSLRLLGIDTEETFRDEGKRALCARDWDEYLRTVYAGTTADRPPKFGTPMGEAAKVYARAFFDGVEKVRLEYDDPKRTLGYFGRHLVHVLAKRDGAWVNYNVEVVREGYSPYFVKYGRSTRYHDAFVAAEAEARRERRGIWAAKPAHHCYPDYEVRLKWWGERDRDLRTIAELKKSDPDLVVLGEDAEWDRLKDRVGQKVTVASNVGGWREAGSRGIVYLSHRNRQDLAIVGPLAEMTEHPIRQTNGDLLLVTGTVSLYRGDPQFMADTVTFKRVSAREPVPNR